MRVPSSATTWPRHDRRSASCSSSTSRRSPSATSPYGATTRPPPCASWRSALVEQARDCSKDRGRELGQRVGIDVVDEVAGEVVARVELLARAPVEYLGVLLRHRLRSATEHAANWDAGSHER